MSNKSPHIVIITGLYGFAHYFQLGTELMERTLREGAIPSLEMASNFALTLSVWLFVVRVIPVGCQYILNCYAFIGRVEASCRAWVQRKLVDLAKWMLARLTQDSPQP